MKDIILNTTYAYGLLTINDKNKIVESAPIYKWMIGKDLYFVKSYLVKKKQFIELIPLPL